MPNNDCNKSRILNMKSAHDTEVAVRVLQQNGLCAICVAPYNQVIVAYQIPQYVLADILKILEENNCLLESNNWQRWRLALISYREEIQLYNMMEQPLSAKHTRDAFVQAYQHHKHGDSDDTLEELRHEK